MQLLFDHHLSPSLVDRLADLFPASQHVWTVKLHQVPDVTVWRYAREHDFIVVSKDADWRRWVSACTARRYKRPAGPLT